MNPNATANLKKRGAEANPNGRPKKGYSITETVKEMFGNEPKAKQALARVILTKALDGDIAAIKILWQYMDGMPQQNVNLTNHDITEVIERLESDYGEFKQDAVEQKVEANTPVQDQEQTGAVGDVQTQSDATQAPEQSPESPLQPDTQG